LDLVAPERIRDSIDEEGVNDGHIRCGVRRGGKINVVGCEKHRRKKDFKMKNPILLNRLNIQYT
jgi:DNA helicase TIP49 (TBP-interacting protein)